MIQTKKYIILFSLTVFSVLLNVSLDAQNYEKTLQFAENQLAEQNYDVALKTFKRLIFFNKDENNYLLHKKVAEIALLRKKYEIAQLYFGLAYNIADDEKIKTELLFDKAYSQILNKKYKFAIIDLLSIDAHDEQTYKKTNFYLGTCYFGLSEFEKAKKYFALCLNDKDGTQLNILFSDKKLNYPSPRKAEILSMVFPGLGQFYAGNVKQGINSMILTAGLFAVGVYSSFAIDPLYGIVTVLPWFQRYYQGGYTNAGKFAKAKRDKNRSRIYNKIIDLINSDFNE